LQLDRYPNYEKEHNGGLVCEWFKSSLLGLSESRKKLHSHSLGPDVSSFFFSLPSGDKSCLSQHFGWLAHAVTYPSGVEWYWKNHSITEW